MKENKDIWFSKTLGKWLCGVAEENNADIEYVEPINMNTEYKKAIEEMIRDYKKKKIMVYLNGIPTVMIYEEE